jgi:hypothetical protein
MAPYAPVKELFCGPEHFLLMVVAGGAVKGFQHLMKFTAPLDP